MKQGILVLIGQIASGKSTLSQMLASRISADWTSAEVLNGIEHEPHKGKELGRLLSEKALNRFLIYECTGVGEDFEALLETLRRKVSRVYVIKLICSTTTAMVRIRERPWSPPRVSPSWRAELEWTSWRLRAVPANLTLDMNNLTPNQAERLITQFLFERKDEPTWASWAISGGTFSYSKLAMYERCPLAFRYRYVDGKKEEFLAEETLLGQAVHRTLSWLYKPSYTSGKFRLDDLLHVYREILFDLVGDSNELLLNNLQNKGEELLRRHFSTAYLFDRLATRAVEEAFSFSLDRGIVFVGQIDRIAETSAGTLVVFDYKTGSSRGTYFSSSPDLLQLEAYGLAALTNYHVTGVEVRKHSLPTGTEETLAVILSDAERIRSALRRWVDVVESSNRYDASPGKPCRWCSYFPSCPSRVGEPSPGLRVSPQIHAGVNRVHEPPGTRW